MRPQQRQGAVLVQAQAQAQAQARGGGGGGDGGSPFAPPRGCRGWYLRRGPHRAHRAAARHRRVRPQRGGGWCVRRDAG